MLKNLFAVLLISCSLTAFADDYVVTQKNDTLRGKVSILTYGSMDHAQIIGADKKKTVLTAIQVTTVFLNNEIYHPVRTNYGYRMMKVVKPGFISLYLGRRVVGPTDTGFYYDVPFLVKRDGSSMEVPNLSFKKSVGNFLSECADIKHKIEKEDLGRNDLDTILDAFNACIEEQTKESKLQPMLQNDDPKIIQLKGLQTKIDASTLAGKKDAVEILNDVMAKVRQHQNVPNYQLDGLKNILKDSPQLLGEFERIASTLNQP